MRDCEREKETFDVFLIGSAYAHIYFRSASRQQRETEMHSRKKRINFVCSFLIVAFVEH